MKKIYGGFKRNEESYSYGADASEFSTIRAEILVDDIEEGMDFMINFFGKDIPVAPFFSWEYREAMNHDRREELKALISKAKEVEVKEVEIEAEEEVLCSCGHSVPKSMVMFSSSGTCCPKCYDRMSF